MPAVSPYYLLTVQCLVAGDWSQEPYCSPPGFCPLREKPGALLCGHCILVIDSSQWGSVRAQQQGQVVMSQLSH